MVTAAVFDNFTIRVGYGSYATVDRHGERYDMTNWASISLPSIAIPTALNISQLIRQRGGNGIFCADLSLGEFARSFLLSSPDLVANQRRRWKFYLKLASDKRLDDRPNFESPYPPTHFVRRPQIRDRLQSSYDDVTFEIDWIRAREPHASSDVLMLGGDGLTYMRLISRLAQKPDFYLWHKPVIIPRLGEHPHGSYHVLHGEWRLWWPLLERANTILGNHNKQVVADPTISQFNECEHFVRILTRAFSEYVVEISLTGNDYRAVDTFLREAEQNLSFAYICQFLYLFAFKFRQLRDSVRTNDSVTLDRIWRENLGAARAATKDGLQRDGGGKTNYSTMSVVHVYWGTALVSPIQRAYHATRTIRWRRAHVGWDMPIEMLNMLIKKSVVSNITHELIEKFLRRLNFTWVVHDALDDVVKANRAADTATLKNIDQDVDLIKEWLRKALGTTYAHVTTPSNENKLKVNMTRWGGDRRTANKRANTPWARRAAAMGTAAEVSAYVRKKMADYCPWHPWC